LTTVPPRDDRPDPDGGAVATVMADATPADMSGVDPLAALPDVPPPSTRRFKTFDSLIDVPAFRWYLLSMSGNWAALQMQQVARGYLAFEMTGSYGALGLVELANTWPRLFLALYGGVIADRVSRRVIIQVGQAVNAVNVGVIALLLFTGNLQFYHLILVSFVQGIINSFVLPARQAMIPEIVGPHRLMNAFALNVMVLNVMRLGAPALAGGIIAVILARTTDATFPEGDTFLAVGVVFTLMSALNVFAVVGLFRVPKTDARTRAALLAQTATVSVNGEAPAPPRRRGGGGDGEGGAIDRTGLRDIKDAFSYLKRERIIIWLMVIHSSTAMLSLPYQRLLPGFVKDVLDGGAQSAALMGALLTVTAVGAILGSLLIASLPDRQRGKILAYSLGVFGVALIAFASSTVFWISAGIVLVLGIGQSIRQSIANILIQARVEDVYRGRVSAIMLLDDGLESLGIFGIAILADVIGAQWALGGVGAIMLVYAGVIWAMKRIRDLD
jgi:MFS family permease